MELDLRIDDIMNELALDDKFGSEVLEPTDFFGMYDWCGFDIRGNVFKIVLALAPVPDPVLREGPGIYLEEKIIQLYHRIVLERGAIYIRISFCNMSFGCVPMPVSYTASGREECPRHRGDFRTGYRDDRTRRIIRVGVQEGNSEELHISYPYVVET